MRKILLSVMIACAVSSEAFALSEDMSVYVRQDVFDAKMEVLFTRLHSEIENLGTRLEGKIDALSERIDGLDKKIDSVEKSLSEKIDAVDKRLSEKIDAVDKKLSARIDGVDKRIDGLDKRIEDTHTFVYWILVLFGAIFLIPFVSKFWELHMERRPPTVTLEDVQRMIVEAINANNAKIRG
ncbi:MAG: hypothetical protein IJR63_11330 [Synergistaceae bacterium]|nr:hypothetical protein [Synergistaceae bacterium]